MKLSVLPKTREKVSSVMALPAQLAMVTMVALVVSLVALLVAVGSAVRAH